MKEVIVRAHFDGIPVALYARTQFPRMLSEALESDSPFQKIAVWKFCHFTRKRERAAAFESTLRQRHADQRADGGDH